MLLVTDLKDAFHSVRFMEESKKYCGILPCFSSASYLYHRMPVGLNVTPAIWQSYINVTLACLQSRNYCEAIMDDLLLLMQDKGSHKDKLEDPLKALLKNGLKISPKKCQLFRKELQFIGNTIFIKGKKVCVKPMGMRIEAIQRLKLPTTSKGCRSFTGVVKCLSLLCPKLQKLLKPINDLMRKGRVFLWEDEQQEAFEEIERWLQNPPVLYMPDNKGRSHLYSDKSKFATGSVPYQIQNGQLRLVAYVSKRMLSIAQNYSIMELELCGLAIYIVEFFLTY